MPVDHEHTKQNSWWEYDGNGIELAKVCEKCVKQVLAKYRPEILNRPYTQDDVDEPIEPEDY